MSAPTPGGSALRVMAPAKINLALEVTARVGEEGKLFGSVTTANIAELLAEKGFKIDRRKIALSESLREAGDHVVPIRLGGGIIANVPLKISAES